MDVVHTLVRDSFALTLLLDEDSGDFHCTCKPEPNAMTREGIEFAANQWFKHLANGYARRQNGSGYYRGAHVESNGGFSRGTVRGKFALKQ